MTFALYELPSTKVTSTTGAPSTTWLFVIIRPDLSYTNPEPSLVDDCWAGTPWITMFGKADETLLVIWTTELLAFLKMAVRSTFWSGIIFWVGSEGVVSATCCTAVLVELGAEVSLAMTCGARCCIDRLPPGA